jgi:hypothetical protein
MFWELDLFPFLGEGRDTYSVGSLADLSHWAIWFRHGINQCSWFGSCAQTRQKGKREGIRNDHYRRTCSRLVAGGTCSVDFVSIMDCLIALIIAGFLDCVHCPVFWKLENITFWKLDLFLSSVEGDQLNQRLRLALSKEPNRVGVSTLTWGWKWNQFPKHVF